MTKAEPPPTHKVVFVLCFLAVIAMLGIWLLGGIVRKAVYYHEILSTECQEYGQWLSVDTRYSERFGCAIKCSGAWMPRDVGGVVFKTQRRHCGAE